MALDAFSRKAGLASWNRLSVGSSVSSSPSTLKRSEAMVSSNRRFQAAWPVTDFSWKSARCGLRAGTAFPCANPRSTGGNATAAPAPSPRSSAGVVEPIQFELEEQQVGRGGGDLFLRVAVKFRPRRIDRVLGIGEPGEGHDFGDQIVDFLVAGDGLEQLLRSVAAGQQPGQSAAIESRRTSRHSSRRRPDILGIFRAVQPGIEVIEPPARQILGSASAIAVPEPWELRTRFGEGKIMERASFRRKSFENSHLAYWTRNRAPFNRDFYFPGLQGRRKSRH